MWGNPCVQKFGSDWFVLFNNENVIFIFDHSKIICRIPNWGKWKNLLIPKIRVLAMQRNFLSQRKMLIKLNDPDVGCLQFLYQITIFVDWCNKTDPIDKIVRGDSKKLAIRPCVLVILIHESIWGMQSIGIYWSRPHFIWKLYWIVYPVAYVYTLSKVILKLVFWDWIMLAYKILVDLS